MPNKSKTVFVCSNCGNESPKWMGKCYACGEWNTYEEQTVIAPGGKPSSSASLTTNIKPVPITSVDISAEIRFSTGMCELDRVLGGGAVLGSLTLVGGDPGIGKSTLLLQICDSFCKERTCYYVSGEESKSQIKLRADRLGVKSDNLMLLSETNIESVVNLCTSSPPDILIVDSIQTMFCSSVSSGTGSVSQIKEATAHLMRLAKENGITVFVIGHVTKEGSLAGPKVIEHMVDTVLYFEGDKSLSFRVLRSIKNRFGSTNEIAVFDMQSTGLAQIDNPSKMFLDGRPENVPGTCVTCVMEGTRAILAEVQALVTKTSYPAPRRMASGVDYNRMSLLLAVLEKRANYSLFSMDAYINVVGGFRLTDNSADLAITLATASALADFEMPSDFIAVGEVGLSGEIRAVSYIEQRISEAQRLGFKHIMVPSRNKLSKNFNGIDVIRVSSLSQAVYKSKELIGNNENDS